MDIDGALTNDQAAVTSVIAGDETFEANSAGSSNIKVERTNEVTAIESNKTSVFSTTNDKETPDSNSPPATELVHNLVEPGKEHSPSFYPVEDFPQKTPEAVSSRLTSVSKQLKTAKLNVFSEKKSIALVDKQLAKGRQINRAKLFDDEPSMPATEENQAADASLSLVPSESVDVVETEHSVVGSSAHLDASQANHTLPVSVSPDANLTGIDMLLQREGLSPKADYSLDVSTVNQLLFEEKKPVEADACDEATSMTAVFETPKMTRSNKRIAPLLRKASERAAKPALVEDSTPKAATGTRSAKKKLVKEVVDEVVVEEAKSVKVDAIEEPKLKSKQSRKAVTATVAKKVGKPEGNSEQKSTNKRTRKRVIEEKEALGGDSKPKATPKRARKMVVVEDEQAGSAKKATPKRTRGGKAANVKEAINNKPTMLTRSRAAAAKKPSTTVPKKATRVAESRTKRVNVNSDKEKTVVKKAARGRTRARR